MDKKMNFVLNKIPKEKIIYKLFVVTKKGYSKLTTN